MSDIAVAYESLDSQSQMEVNQLVFRLAAKRTASSTPVKRSRDEVVAMLQSMMGTSHAWHGGDVLEYQRQLRGEYRENGDSIQFATSIDCGCDCFYTNDYQLKQVTEANVIYMGE